ncbi:MAG: hypothetical protein BAJATHORv1_90052 [Candidatus Thorarchaeota archaeon]|nr:MAG: hypothetical protein BAJATHORv1_90052 [Candidatus Thorarchaeota archaeon]
MHYGVADGSLSESYNAFIARNPVEVVPFVMKLFQFLFSHIELSHFYYNHFYE